MPLQVRATGATSGGDTTNPLQIAQPAGATNGDLLVAVIEAGTGALTNHASATNWTEHGFRGQAATTGNTLLTVLARIKDGTEADPVDFTQAGTINHMSGRMTAIQDHGLATTADIVTSTTTGGTASTTGTALTVNVTAGSLVLVIGGLALDANSTAAYSAWTNANLANLNSQEIMDNVVNTGNGGGFGCAWGICAGTSTGQTTWTQTSEAWNGWHIAIKPLAETPSLALERKRPHAAMRDFDPWSTGGWQ